MYTQKELDVSLLDICAIYFGDEYSWIVQDDPALLLELKDDVREECERLGEVTNVIMYDVSTLSMGLAIPLYDSFFYIAYVSLSTKRNHQAVLSRLDIKSLKAPKHA